jgi:hypothetical protein
MMFNNDFSGVQENKVKTSCLMVTILIVVTLPMTKNDFIAKQEKYILSVATTAGVIPEYVNVLSVNETSKSSTILPGFVKVKMFNEASALTSRMLLATVQATSVDVTTSIQFSDNLEQHASIENQSALNENLIQNGLPSCTSVVFVLTPGPGDNEAPNQTQGHAPKSFMNEIQVEIPGYATIVIGVIGLLLLSLAFLFYIHCRQVS